MKAALIIVSAIALAILLLCRKRNYPTDKKVVHNDEENNSFRGKYNASVREYTCWWAADHEESVFSEQRKN